MGEKRMKKYTINLIATLGIDIEAETEEEAINKAYDILDMRDFEISDSEIIEND